MTQPSSRGFEHAWLSSVLETVSLADPVIGAFDGAAHSRVVEEFCDADRAHRDSGPDRIRRAVAEWAVSVRDAHPTESDLVQHQARLRRRHLPIRALFQAAPHVLGAVKPCWAMSPLVVAQCRSGRTGFSHSPAMSCVDRRQVYGQPDD